MQLGILYVHLGGLDTILASGIVQSLMAGDLVISPAQVLSENYDLSIGSISTFSRSLNGNILREGDGRANSSVFVASVVPDVIAMALGSFWETQDQSNGLTRPMGKTSSNQDQMTGLQKPVVHVQCTGPFNTLSNLTTDVLTFPSVYHYPKVTSGQFWTLPLTGILANSSFNDSDDLVAFQWVDLKMPEEDNQSAAAVFLVPEATYQASAPDLPDVSHQPAQPRLSERAYRGMLPRVTRGKQHQFSINNVSKTS